MERKPTDARLVRSYRAGKETAFEMLYKRYERPLFSFILKFVKERAGAQDVFQQTWMKVIRGLESYEEKGKFSSWMFGIANNACVDQARKRSRAKIDDFASEEGLDAFKSEGPDPEDVSIETEKKQWLDQAVSRLPVEQKEVVLLRLQAEIPFKEIAKMLDTPLNTVLGRMHYAMRNLKKMVTEDYGEVAKDVLS